MEYLIKRTVKLHIVRGNNAVFSAFKVHRMGCDMASRMLDDDVKSTPGLGGDPSRSGEMFSDDHPYFPSECKGCPFDKSVLGVFRNKVKNCYKCKGIRSMVIKADVTQMLTALTTADGKRRIELLKQIVALKDFKPIAHHRGVYMFGDLSGIEDYNNLLKATSKAVGVGYEVYILPNPKSTKSADFILKRNQKVYMYELKSLSGKSTAAERLASAAKQSNRIILNITGNIDMRTLAKAIKHCFENYNHVVEIKVFRGKKEITIYNLVKFQSDYNILRMLTK